jgi:hypothetical protein
MAEDQEHPDDEQREAPMLDYRARAADRSPISTAQMLGGFIVGMLVVGGGIAVGTLASLGTHANVNLILICFLCSGFVVNLLGALNYFRAGARGYGIGLWIGFGVMSAGFWTCLGFGA